MKKILAFLLACSCLYACNNASESKKTDLLLSNIDSTVKPGDDFFEYANGGWIKRTPMPESESGWGIGNLVQDEIYNRLRKINEDAVADKKPEGTISQKIGDFWQTAMDTVALDKAGIAPLKEDLAKINAIQSTTDLLNLAPELDKKGVGILFSDYVAQDDKNSEMMAFKLDQGGLGMPNRDYYFKTDERTAKVRAAYKVYLLKTFKQLGDDEAAAQKNADGVYALETKLAAASRKLEDLRDPYKNYNKMDVEGLNKLTANIDWHNYLMGLGITKLDSVIVGQPEFYSALSNEIKNTSIDDWKNYLRFHLVLSYATYLDKTSFGRYFYENKGIDIPLHVTGVQRGKISLVEEVACKQDGSNCPGASDYPPTKPPLGAKWELTSKDDGDILEGNFKSGGRNH